ncbi:MAG: DUF4421 domain-containing protein, partial [Prevotella sp.]|nr:DUF4421 domain-containing protein [Prevotella sp.]
MIRQWLTMVLMTVALMAAGATMPENEVLSENEQAQTNCPKENPERQKKQEDKQKVREIGSIRKTIRGFSAIDTNYIEPQHYNYTVMLQ